MSTRTTAKASGKQDRPDTLSPNLPLSRPLTLPYRLSLLIALLLATVALVGLLLPEVVYPEEAVRLSFFPVDLFHLAVGLPALLGSLWRVRRGRLAALLCWPGILLYLLYSYITNLLGVPFGILFLPYLCLVTLSAYTTIALVGAIDGEAVRCRLGGPVPRRATAYVLVGLSGLFLATNTSAILSALFSRPPTLPAHPTFVLIADFTTVIPICLLGGSLLWRRRPLGYALGAGLLLFYTLLLTGLVPVLLFPTFYDGSPPALVDTGLMLACGLLCLFLLARFLRAAGTGAADAGTTVPGALENI